MVRRVSPAKGGERETHLFGLTPRLYLCESPVLRAHIVSTSLPGCVNMSITALEIH
jgi:hypothetical protein